MQGILVFPNPRQQMRHISQDKIQHSESSTCLTSGICLIYIFLYGCLHYKLHELCLAIGLLALSKLQAVDAAPATASNFGVKRASLKM
jgi:hypothetical protein